MFEIGQLVVCIEESPIKRYRRAFKSGPKKGDVVTIREIFCAGDTVGLIFEEHINGNTPSGFEVGFDSVYFRPVTKRNEEIIAGLLVPKKDEVDA